MKKGFLLTIGLLLVTAACSPAGTPAPASTLTIAPPLNPYQSATRTPEPPTPTLIQPTTAPLLPSPTPFKYAVKPGDTLYGIAIQYNVTLDQLVLANPGVDTSILSIGMELVIPASEDEGQGAPTPTPFPLPQEEAACYPSEDGSLWCYILIENDQDFALDNITMAFNIFSDAGQLQESILAFPLLNTLFPGQSIPIGVFIEDSPGDQPRITGTLLAAFPSELAEPGVEISDYSIQYAQDNTIAEVSGTYLLLDPDQEGAGVWITGYGLSDGKVAGVRKWASQEALEEGTEHPFSFQIYSLGPRMDRIELLIEVY